MSIAPPPGSKQEMEAGVQPLDRLMAGLGLGNHALVAALPASGLTHKVVAKGRRGRRLTRRAQEKIVKALNSAAGPSRVYGVQDCFNYRGR